MQDSSPSSDRVCGHCQAPGNFSNTANAPQCTLSHVCPPSQYVTAAPTITTDRTCSSCDSLSFSTANNSDACTAHLICGPALYISVAATASSDRQCQDCASGTFSSKENEAACNVWTTCGAGTYITQDPSASADRECDTCALGDFSLGNVHQCTIWTTCDTGTYVSVDGSPINDRECANCADGFFTADVNLDGCSPFTVCKPGEHVTTTPMASRDRVCETCGDGTFSLADNTDKCSDHRVCPAGTHVTVQPTKARDRECAVCEPGYISSLINLDSCTACGANRYQPLTNQTACRTIDIGSYGVGTKNAFSAQAVCEDGFYCDVGVRYPWHHCQPSEYESVAPTRSTDRECDPCPDGHHSTDPNAERCTKHRDCSPGAYQTVAATPTSNRECQNCTDGFFSTVINQLQCNIYQVCPYGSKVTIEPSSVQNRECELCPSGSYSSEKNANSCTSCALNTYQDQVGQTGCMALPSGTYSDGKTLPKPCEAGYQCVVAKAPAESNHVCSSVGTLQFTTFDDRRFDNSTQGEFVLVSVPSSLELQVRQEAWGNAAGNTVLAFRGSLTGNHRIGVSAPNSRFQLHIDDFVVQPLANPMVVPDSEVKIVGLGSSFVDIAVGGALQLRIRCWASSQLTSRGDAFLNVQVSMLPTAAEGLCGNYNGQAADDDTGAPRVAQAASLFLYTENHSYTTINSGAPYLGFTPCTAEQTTLQTEAQVRCSRVLSDSADLAACIQGACDTNDLGASDFYLFGLQGRAQLQGALQIPADNAQSLYRLPCPSGTNQPEEQQTRCHHCDNATYQDQFAALGCKPVTAGFFGEGESPLTGASVATMCPLGSFCPGGDVFRQPAPVGFYVDMAGQAHPHVCGSIKFQDQPEQTSCHDISLGFYGTGGNVTTRSGQTICPAGTFCVDGLRFDCAPGRSQQKTGQTECDPCGAPDKFSAAGAPSCTAVSTGFYTTPETGLIAERTNQMECPTGYACLNGLRTACLVPDLGQFLTDGTVPGTYQPQTGQTTCLSVRLCTPEEYMQAPSTLTTDRDCSPQPFAPNPVATRPLQIGVVGEIFPTGPTRVVDGTQLRTQLWGMQPGRRVTATLDGGANTQAMVVPTSSSMTYPAGIAGLRLLGAASLSRYLAPAQNEFTVELQVVDAASVRVAARFGVRVVAQIDDSLTSELMFDTTTDPLSGAATVDVRIPLAWFNISAKEITLYTQILRMAEHDEDAPRATLLVLPLLSTVPPPSPAVPMFYMTLPRQPVVVNTTFTATVALVGNQLPDVSMVQLELAAPPGLVLHAAATLQTLWRVTLTQQGEGTTVGGLLYRLTLSARGSAANLTMTNVLSLDIMIQEDVPTEQEYELGLRLLSVEQHHEAVAVNVSDVVVVCGYSCAGTGSIFVASDNPTGGFLFFIQPWLINTAIIDGQAVTQRLSTQFVLSSGRVLDSPAAVMFSLDRPEIGRVSEHLFTLEGTEQAGGFATLYAEYGGLKLAAPMFVSYPTLPLELTVTDPTLSAIRGWQNDSCKADRYQQARVVARAAMGMMDSSTQELDVSALLPASFVQVAPPGGDTAELLVQWGSLIVRGLAPGTVTLVWTGAKNASLELGRTAVVIDSEPILVTRLDMFAIAGVDLSLDNDMLTAQLEMTFDRENQRGVLVASVVFADGMAMPVTMTDGLNLTVVQTNLLDIDLLLQPETSIVAPSSTIQEPIDIVIFGELLNSQACDVASVVVAGQATVRVAPQAAQGLSVVLASDTLAPSGDALTLLSIDPTPSTSNISVAVLYQDHTLDLTQDSRVEFDLSASNNLFSVQRDLINGVPVIVVNDEGLYGTGLLIVRPTHLTALEARVTVRVVATKAVAVALRPFPAYEGSDEQSLTVLRAIAGSQPLAYQQAAVQATLMVSDGSERQVSTDPALSMSAATTWIILDTAEGSPTTVRVQSGAGDGGETLETQIVVRLSNIEVAAVAVRAETSTPITVTALDNLTFVETLSGPVGTVREVDFTIIFSDGSHLVSAYSTTTAGERIAIIPGLVTLISSVPAAAAVDGTSGRIKLLGNHYRLVSVTAAASLTSSAATSVALSVEFACNLEPVIGDVDLGEMAGIALPQPKSPSQTIHVPIRVNIGQQALGAIDAQFLFDERVFEVLTVQAGSGWGPNALMFWMDNDVGRVGFGGITAGGRGVVEVVIITLEVKAPDGLQALQEGNVREFTVANLWMAGLNHQTSK